MTQPTKPPCPAPCPEFCTRPADHGLYDPTAETWSRIHLGDPIYPGPVCLAQSDVVDADGGVRRGPMRLDGPNGSLEITVVLRRTRTRAVAA